MSEPPTVSAATKEFRLIRGKTVTLTCTIKDATTMWWKRLDGRNEIDINSYKSSNGETSILTIRNIQARDDGDYKCYGRNAFGINYDIIKISSGCKSIWRGINN